ncbi:DNA repair protein RAD51 homolog 2-like [Asterias rubens]|uniref:DNA repair protein RAD51 homolog 2-like n=1 Tax=Asterias rubens TaxID=7604 RepID=UPI0014556820|nr:DNA repair protein RAD51 homolog 2-like [Asterias rubens]
MKATKLKLPDIVSSPVISDALENVSFRREDKNPTGEHPRNQVIVTNQVTTWIGAQRASLQDPAVDKGSAGTVDDCRGDGGSYVMAALGNTWSHSVNTRLILQYLDESRREVLVAKSPIAPFVSLVYTIQDKGIQLEVVLITLQLGTRSVATPP